MLETVKARIEHDGTVTLLEPVPPGPIRQALVTILEPETTTETIPETALLSEQALAKDWNRPEEDAAWAHLQ